MTTVLRSSAAQTAQQREEQRFGKELPHDAQAAGAERHADANLAFARDAARQDEGSEIGAGRDEQQQHQRCGGERDLELFAVGVERVDRPRLEILVRQDPVGPALAQARGECTRLVL